MVQVLALNKTGVLARYEQVWEYLTCLSFDDGSERQTATLLLFVDGSELKACLNDRAERQTLWASGEGLEACLASLERQLQGDTTSWKRYKPTAPRKKS